MANSNLAAFSVSKHFTKGWTAHAIYTYGKSLDYTSSNDNDNGNGGAENIYDAATSPHSMDEQTSTRANASRAIWYGIFPDSGIDSPTP